MCKYMAIPSNEGLLIPRGQMRQAQTRLQSWPAHKLQVIWKTAHDCRRTTCDRNNQDNSGLMRASLSRGPENPRPWWDSGGPASNRQHLREVSSAYICLRAWGPEWCSTKSPFFLLVGLLATNEKRWSFCGAPLWPSGWEGYAEPLSGAAWYWLALPWSSPSLQVRVVASATTGLTLTIWLATRLLKVFLLQMHRLQRTIQLPSSRHKSQCV